MSERNHSFIFLGDLLKLEIEHSAEIINGYNLKKADLRQIEIIDRTLGKLGGRFSIFKNRFKMSYTKDISGNSFTAELLTSQEDWNYWIIEHDFVQDLSNLQIALKLCKLDLNPLFEIIYLEQGGSAGTSIGRECLTFIDDDGFNCNFKIVTKNDIKEIQVLLNEIDSLISHKDDFKYIHKALIDFSHVKELSRRNSFVIIGLYSIVESLITHNPKRGEDSITHQLKTKLNLLNNKFENKINHLEYFKGPDSTKFETIIEKLYSYRSDIAHGDFADFNKKLKIIADNETSFNFLYTLVKELLKYSLKDPQLIIDLKAC